MPTLGIGDGVTGPSGSSFQMATWPPQMVGGIGRAMTVIRWTMTMGIRADGRRTNILGCKEQLSYAI